MTTRRNILKSGAGLAAILASGKAPAYLVKSMLAARNSISMRAGGANLPYDAEVEYIRAVGTSTESPWIDTGVNVLAGDEIFIKIIAPSAATSFSIGSVIFSDFFNSSLTGGGVGIGRFSGPPVRAYFLDRNETATVANYGNGLVSYRLNSNSLTVSIGDTHTRYDLVALSGYTEDRGTLGLFGCSKRTTHPVYDFSCVQFTIDRGGLLVRDMIPVRFTNELGQSEGAMYDRANPTVGMNSDGTPRDDGLYLNRGTGAFIIDNAK